MVVFNYHYNYNDNHNHCNYRDPAREGSVVRALSPVRARPARSRPGPARARADPDRGRSEGGGGAGRHGAVVRPLPPRQA